MAALMREQATRAPSAERRPVGGPASGPATAGRRPEWARAKRRESG